MSSSSQIGRAILVSGEATSTTELRRAEEVLAFYGLDCVRIEAKGAKATGGLAAELASPATLAVLIAQDALPSLDRETVERARQRVDGTRVPLMIFGISEHNDAGCVREWSGGAVADCEPYKSSRPTAVRVEQPTEMTGILAGVELPAVACPSCTMLVGDARLVTTVLSAGRDGTFTPVMLRVGSGQEGVFFVAAMETFDLSWIGHPLSVARAFSHLAPFLLFVRHAAGEHGWHLDGHYANFTIDDPWLTEPYGHLDYTRLLGEMEKHNFHTTIAFVPWNFDRSQSKVTQLFRENANRYSVCIHGNDHIHREFADYSKAPLEMQIGNIKQAAARMQKFEKLTGICADRFMVFPHGAAPEPTLSALKRYDFLATANSLYVPLGKEFPKSATFVLRTFTNDYAAFLSIARYSAEAEIPWLDIRIHAFLGNPLLFYGHQQIFASGAEAFNEVADGLNRIQPDTKWVSLGQMARQIRLIRRRTDGTYEVRMLANETELCNTSAHNKTFEIRRTEDESVKVRSITVNGRRVGAEASGDSPAFTVDVPAGAIVSVQVRYENDLDLATQDILKKSVHAAIVRRLSDFRDLYLSRWSLGRSLEKAYYKNRWDSVEILLERKWFALLSFVAAVFSQRGLKGRRS